MKTLDLTKTLSSRSAGICLTVSVLCLAAGGCAAPVGEPSQDAAMCTPSVETRIHTAGLWSNGIQNNGMTMNGFSMNGIQENGTRLNGVRASDVVIGSVRLDRVDLTADGELVASTAERSLSGDALVGARS
jgi:hypothetical protein